MAEYMHRPGEVLLLVLEFARGSEDDVDGSEQHSEDDTMAPADHSEVVAAAKLERERFDTKTVEYFQLRNRRLEELMTALDAILQGESDPTTHWRQPLIALTSDADQTLDKILENITEPSKRAVGLQWKLSTEEAAFVDNLFTKDLGVRFGDIMKVHKKLEETNTRLSDCWTKLMSRVEEIDRSAASVTDSIVDMLDMSIDKSQDYHRPELIKELSSAVAELNRIKDRKPALKIDLAVDRWLAEMQSASVAVLESIKSTVMRIFAADAEQWSATATDIVSNTAVLRGLQSGELELHKILADERTKTAEFMREPSDQRARRLLDEAKTFLSDWKGSLPTSAMQSDAEEFRSNVIGRVAPMLTAIEDLHKKFAGENEGKFYGSLKSEVVEKLFLGSTWKERYSLFISVSADYFIKVHGEEMAKLCSVDLQTPWTAVIQAIKTCEVPADKVDARNRLADELSSQWSNLQANVITPRQNGLAEMIKRAHGAVTSPDLIEAFARSKLASNLRST